MTISLTIYAFTTKTDFTMCGGFIFMLVILSIGGGILGALFPSKTGDIILSLFGVFCGGFYLIYDT